MEIFVMAGKDKVNKRGEYTQMKLLHSREDVLKYNKLNRVTPEEAIKRKTGVDLNPVETEPGKPKPVQKKPGIEDWRFPETGDYIPGSTSYDEVCTYDGAQKQASEIMKLKKEAEKNQIKYSENLNGGKAAVAHMRQVELARAKNTLRIEATPKKGKKGPKLSDGPE
jgi:hypothetical protein